jgi:hypothetical protein
MMGGVRQGEAHTPSIDCKPWPLNDQAMADGARMQRLQLDTQQQSRASTRDEIHYYRNTPLCWGRRMAGTQNPRVDCSCGQATMEPTGVSHGMGWEQFRGKPRAGVHPSGAENSHSFKDRRISDAWGSL